jgi:hypothetical protein
LQKHLHSVSALSYFRAGRPGDIPPADSQGAALCRAYKSILKHRVLFEDHQQRFTVLPELNRYVPHPDLENLKVEYLMPAMLFPALTTLTYEPSENPRFLEVRDMVFYT